MCDTCGCNITPGNREFAYKPIYGKTAVSVLKNLLARNDDQAEHNRQHFDRYKLLAINLTSSPGAGKTALLEATIDALGDQYRIGVIEGDLETEYDAVRIRAKGAPAHQITTGSACHLDAHMVHDALHAFPLEELDFLFIENVGNLVCPASFDLGQHRNVTLLSVTEGDDKPAKYPFDGLVAPGHVSTIMGPEEWNFVFEKHGIPTAVAGFQPVSLLAAMYSVLRQLLEGKRFLDNCYPELVRPGGNQSAQAQLAEALHDTNANWRGIGVIPASGFALNPRFAKNDARIQFPAFDTEGRKRAGQMPPGCECASVVLGKINPNQCKIYGRACTPKTPVGPCMVSDEGACRIWWAAGVRANAATAANVRADDAPGPAPAEKFEPGGESAAL